jgi:SAM-dependent methyltransferase
MRRGRRLFAENSENWALPLSKLDKLLVGGHIILKDYSTGRFPPTFEDQAKAYEAEVTFLENTPGISAAEHIEAHQRKPFWGCPYWEKSARDLTRLLRALDGLAVPPKGWILELGCGCGWMAEFLALAGYSVIGTSIAPSEIGIARQRAEAFGRRDLANELRFEVTAMETVDQAVDRTDFDVVYTYEALHHAFDWREAMRSAFRCLKPGGWLILANEPNVLHTYISYRVARIGNLHDIGMSRRELVAEMKGCGFGEIRVLAPRLNNRVTFHWIAARR